MTLDINLLRKKLGITNDINIFSILGDLHEGVIIADIRGNAAKAARILGISPQSLHYKLKKFKIDRKNFIGN